MTGDDVTACHLLASVSTEREKFYPGPVLEPGSPALLPDALTTILDRYRSVIELLPFNYPFWHQDCQSLLYYVLFRYTYIPTLWNDH